MRIIVHTVMSKSTTVYLTTILCLSPAATKLTRSRNTKETDFIPVEVIGKSAEFCANYISKGRLVAVQGNLRVDRYQTQSGENRTFTKVSSRSVQALDSNRGKSENPYVESHQGSQAGFEPSFEPTQGLDPNGFQAIDDDDIPF